jgi:serine/threonine-protein kinase
MTSKEDVQFLALLVHRGQLARNDAERLLPMLKEGHGLDELLVRELGWEPARVEQMRRTNAGEIPEIPGFQVLGKLGEGGTAAVFRAREKKANRVVALKVLNAESTRNPATRKAFVAEARLLERISHPGLVKGYGVAKYGSTYFSRMEVVEGHTLIEHLDSGHVFDESAALRIVLEVAEVLAYLAEEGVIHRDVKPGNIMLSSAGQVKLIDLGFAAEGETTASPEDSAVGTVAYLSPEAAVGGAVADMRSDIYSLGVTLFQLVVGRLPFEGSDDREVLRMQIMESLSSPELKGRNLSPHLHYFIEKMMAKDKDVRYQSWAELTDDIKSQLEGRDSLDFRSGGGGSGVRRRHRRR